VVKAEHELLLKFASRGDGTLHLRTDEPSAVDYLAYLQQSGERTLAQVYRGSVSAPLTVPARLHAFAEGDTRLMLSEPRETLLLRNPGPTAINVQVLVLAAGAVRAERRLTITGNASMEINMNTWIGPSQHGIVVRSDRPILVGRSIDFNENADRLLSYGIVAG
jgi:hypothetical protein